MESMDRNLEQALTLCPSLSGLTPSRHNDLLEVLREFLGSSDAPWLERRYSCSESSHPQGSDSEFSGDLCMSGYFCNSDAYCSWGQGTGSLDGGASATPPWSGYYALGDFDSSDSELWFRLPSGDSYLGLDSLRRSGLGTTHTSGRGRQLVVGPHPGIAHRRSGVRIGGHGDQVACHSARKGNVVVVET
jgi:hypothetical protein